MDEEGPVPSREGMSDPSPGGAEVKEGQARSSVSRCEFCSSHADLLREVLSLLQKERAEAAERECRLRRDYQLVTQRLKGLEDELENLRSAIASPQGVVRYLTTPCFSSYSSSREIWRSRASYYCFPYTYA